MESEPLKPVREAVAKLFSLLDVQRVICVDDAYAPSLVYVNELIVLVGPERALQVAALQDLPLEQEDVWRGLVQQRWQQLEQAEQREVYNNLRSLLKEVEIQIDPAAEREDGRADLIATGLLEEILQSHTFIPLSPTEWRERRAEFVASEGEGQSLFLFDVNLTNDGDAPEGGIRLLHEFLALGHSQAPICGILSHTFSAADEQAKAEELITRSNLAPETFLAISKDRLHQDPLSFARLLKITLINSACQSLREHVKEILVDACNKAGERLSSISTYDFEHIVFQVSQREGIWEPDTLFRVFGLFQRKAALERAKVDTVLEGHAQEIRRVSGILTESPLAPHDSWKIQRLELYEDRDYLNTYHVPIDLGDIFETLPTTKGQKLRRFILLKQPCDLMVRANGERHYTVHEGMLAEIRDALPTDSSGRETGHESHGDLLYFGDEDGATGYVSFRHTFSVLLCVLDLCVFNKEGIARLVIDEPCPDSLLPSWRARYERLQGRGRAVVRHAEQLSKRGLPAKDVNLALPQPSHETTFARSIDPKTKTIHYYCQRIGRLCQPRAVALLAELNSYSSRPGFEADLGRE